VGHTPQKPFGQKRAKRLTESKRNEKAQAFLVEAKGLDHTTTNTSRLIEQSELGQRGIFN